MPKLSGVELLSKLRCQERTRDIPALLLTARGFAVSEQDRASGNIKRVIAKPFSPREVLACANKLLEQAVVPAA
jgi:CheY-like chemotaxis protein